MIRSGLQVPGPYQDWVTWLEAFGRGEDRPATHLVPCTDSLGPEMVSRLVAHVVAAYRARTQRWNDLLSRDLSAVTTTTAYAAALVAARHRLAPLRGLAECSLLPETVRTGLAEALTNLVGDTQQALEDGARRGGADLLMVVREQKLTAALTGSARPPSPASPGGPAPAGRRRIIL